MRRLSFTVLLVAICLLPVGIGTGASAHSHAKAALDGALANTSAAQAQVLEDYFSRARSIDLLTAKNPAFRHFYALPGDRPAKVRRGGQPLDEVNEALANLEELFPARPYVSPDTKEWVISNSTLMPTSDGSKRAIVHFEVTIESFRKVAASLANQFDITVVEAKSGQVVLDSRRPQQIGAPR